MQVNLKLPINNEMFKCYRMKSFKIIYHDVIEGNDQFRSLSSELVSEFSAATSLESFLPC